MNSVRQLSVLVVDDKAFVRTMTGRIFASVGIENILMPRMAAKRSSSFAATIRARRLGAL